MGRTSGTGGQPAELMDTTGLVAIAIAREGVEGGGLRVPKGKQPGNRKGGPDSAELGPSAPPRDVPACKHTVPHNFVDQSGVVDHGFVDGGNVAVA